MAGGRREVPVRRFDVLVRVLLATAGGYLFAAVAGLWIEYLLGADPRAAAITSNMVFFLVHAAVVVWVFAATGTMRVAVAILGTSLLGGLSWMAVAGASA